MIGSALLLAFLTGSRTELCFPDRGLAGDPRVLIDVLRALGARVRTKGPRVFAMFAAVASVVFLADGLYGLVVA